jgi:Glycerol-3-phosphate responsive antiterminator (mRNA-binding)
MSPQEKVMTALHECPIIASLQKPEMVTAAIQSNVRIVMISSGDIFTIGKVSQCLKSHNKLILVHVDMIGGMARDKFTVQYLKEKLEVDGIVTPNGQLVASGHKEGLLTAQRFFAHDTPSVVSGINALRKSKPDLIEIMPGVAVLKVYEEVRKHFQQPIIAAGLIRSIPDVKQILKAGAVGVDTSNPNLWNFSIPNPTTERLS